MTASLARSSASSSAPMDPSQAHATIRCDKDCRLIWLMVLDRTTSSAVFQLSLSTIARTGMHSCLNGPRAQSTKDSEANYVRSSRFSTLCRMDCLPALVEQRLGALVSQSTVRLPSAWIDHTTLRFRTVRHFAHRHGGPFDPYFTRQARKQPVSIV